MNDPHTSVYDEGDGMRCTAHDGCWPGYSAGEVWVPVEDYDALHTENAALKEKLEAMREIATGTHATMTEIYDAMHGVLGAGPHPPCCDDHAPLNYGDCPSGPCACGYGDE